MGRGSQLRQLVWPSGFHAKRWRLITAWIILFTLAAIWAFKIVQHQSDNLCKVTDAFITVNLRVTSEQNKKSIQSIGLRQDAIRASLRMQKALAEPLSRQFPVLPGFLEYLRAEATLARDLNQSERDILRARLDSQAKIRQLRTELSCES